MKTITVIQCNHVGWEGSTDVSLRRDPRQKYVIESVMERAKTLTEADPVPVIACPDLEENKIFLDLAAEHGCQVEPGSNSNVLDRLTNACTRRGGDSIAWLQGIHYFLHAPLMDKLLRWAKDEQLDYARCPDASCKFMLGQFIRLDALDRAMAEIEKLDEASAGFYRARPFAFMRTRPDQFSVGLFEELPAYGRAELEQMRETAKTIYVEERAIHTTKAEAVGDISRGRYTAIEHLLPPSGRFVDIACGTGYGCRLLHGDNRSVIGVDVSRDAVDFARSHNGDFADFRLGDAERIPVDDESVDCLVSVATIEHVDDDAGFVNEIHRVLVPGGTAVVYTPQNRLPHEPIWPWHYREYSLEQLRDLLGRRLTVERVLGWQNGVITESDPRGDGMYVFATKPNEG